MLIIILLIILTAGGILAEKYFDILWPLIISLVSGILLLVALILLPISRMDFNSKKAKYSAFKETLKTARISTTDLENAAITAKVAEWNEWIAENKYYNSTMFDLWIPDEIEKLEPAR